MECLAGKNGVVQYTNGSLYIHCSENSFCGPHALSGSAIGAYSPSPMSASALLRTDRASRLPEALRPAAESPNQTLEPMSHCARTLQARTRHRRMVVIGGSWLSLSVTRIETRRYVYLAWTSVLNHRRLHSRRL